MRKNNLQRKIQQSVKRKMGKIESLLSNEAIRTTKNDFLEKFMLCETACKSIISWHNKETGKKTPDKDIKLHVKSIEAALRYAGYPIDGANIAIVFGSTDKRGQKSCKKLRDGIVHSMSSEDIQEVINRYTYLFGEMQRFLDGIHNSPLPQIKKVSRKKKQTRKQPNSVAA